MRLCLAAIISLACCARADAQSLYLDHGQRAIEVAGGWSAGPASTGFELTAGASIDGRTDLGITFARYTYTFDDGSESRFREYAPYARVFVVKEQHGAPVSLSINAQVFFDDYEADGDKGRYVQAGTTIYKQLKLAEHLSIQPFAGFAFVAESYSFGGGDAERDHYLSRELGVHFTTNPSRPWIARATVSEQSFRRETYRGARLSVIRRL